MKNYLFYFGYLGTRFCGVQRQANLGRKDHSIVRYLEDSLLSLSPSNTPFVYTASRTDAGVHAICSTFGSKLCLPPISGHGIDKNEEVYITANLNKFFKDSDLDIRIYKTQHVPYRFDCRRSAIQRTYLYRLAHFPSQLHIPGVTTTDPLPIAELNRCHLIRGNFDVEAVQSACEILKGEHDFRYFTTIRKNENIKTKKILYELKVVPGRSLFRPGYDEQYEHLTFWDVIVSSRSFLYNQVRRIVSLLIGVGEGKVGLKYVEATILNPHMERSSDMRIIKPDGLYLLNIEYSPQVFLEKPYKHLKETDKQDIKEKSESEQE